ncbi:hypothetical protein SLG_26430 [Sphingobium sp. SYK-6]|nr:hypothetical protein SLG_26430 [Sphingobium sp. SYK-6]
MCRMKLFVTPAIALMVGSTAPAQQPAPPSCTRTCLEGWVDRYLVAMRDAKVDEAMFARDVKFTENGIQLPLGDEGLWHSMSALGTYKFTVPDIETQQVAFLGTVREKNRDGKESVVAIALRLKIRGDRITEIEQLASRPADTNSSRSDIPPTGVGVEKMGQPHPWFTAPIPVAQRQTREELVKTANYYFTGLQRNDGKGYYPFTDDCIRFENGMDVLANALDPTTGKRGRMTCKYQFEAALKNIVSRVRDRRFVAVDRERGIVFAFAFFDHEQINWTWQLGELFRIENGQIRRIEAIFHRAPYGINSGWSTYEQGLSDQIQDIR